MAFTVQGVEGRYVYPTDKEAYIEANHQYATSSEGVDHAMTPGAIYYPSSSSSAHAEIAQLLLHAEDKGYAVAIRTGGHQYSGASSTNKDGVLVDLSQTFRDGEDRTLLPKDSDAKKTHFYTSVSWSLKEFTQFLQNPALPQRKYHQDGDDWGYFVPTGQCWYVNVGGHVQTGGYGQFGRSFGLLSDYVEEITLVDPTNTSAGREEDKYKKVVTADSDPELFFGLLGGSPGNFGVVTHVKIKIQCDYDHRGPSTLLKRLNWKGAYGERTIFPYDTNTYKMMLRRLATLSDQDLLPKSYDFCLNVVSRSFHGLPNAEGLQDILDDVYGPEPPGTSEDNDQIGSPYPLIVMYAQYIPLQDPQTGEWSTRDQKYFDLFTKSLGLDPRLTQVFRDKVSNVAQNWLLTHHREFKEPYIKRTFLTASNQLSTNGWVDAVGDQINTLIWSRPGLRTSSQLQWFGGKNSAYFQNGIVPEGHKARTATPWRDTRFISTVDCFYDPGHLQAAKDWQKKNDEIFIGDKAGGNPALYSDEDRRIIWGSFNREGEDWSLDALRDKYFDQVPDPDGKTKYQRLMAARQRYDSKGVFTPNVFCVKNPNKPHPPQSSPPSSGLASALSTNASSTTKAPINNTISTEAIDRARLLKSSTSTTGAASIASTLD